MNEIEERVVEMQFDNTKFEKNIQTSIKSLNNLDKELQFKNSGNGFSNLQKIVNSFSLDPINRGIETIQYKFNAMQIAGITVIQNLTNSAMAMAKKITRAFTIDPIRTGLQEYETQIGAVQTILANTEEKGSTLQDVNRALDELNSYADQTIYNFTEMTRNIGTFTAAGVDLEKSVSAIKGIANLAAVSGSTSQQASAAMYQLSQALAAGKVQLMDWNSVVNAGMGGEVFQTALKRTAKQMGHNVDQLIAQYGSFRESLTKGQWLTSEVLIETLTQLSGAYTEADLISQGYTEDQAKQITQLAETAVNAATKVKTFTQLMDTTKEAVQSGWTQTWEIVIGDFEESKELWTSISNVLGNIINNASEARNTLLSGGLSSGWKQFLNAGISDENAIKDAISSIANEYGVSVDDMIAKTGSFEASLKEGWLTSEILSKSVNKLATDVSELSEEEKKSRGYTTSQVEELVKFNEEIQNGNVNLDKFTELMTKGSGRDNILSGLVNIFKSLAELIKPIKEGFSEIFPAITSDQLYNLTVRFKELTERISISKDAINNIKNSFKGVFAVLSLGKQILESIGTVFINLASRILPVGNGFLNITSSIGSFLVSIDEAAKKSNVFTSIANGVITAFDKLTSVISTTVEKISTYLTNLGNIVGGEMSVAFSNVQERVKSVISPFSILGKVLSTTFNLISSAFIKLQPILLGLGYILATIVKYITDSISKLIHSFDANQAIDIVNSGLFAAILLGVKNFMDSLSSVTDGASGILDNINKIISGLGDTLSAFQDQVKSKTLIQIASAVGILAASLFVIASIDSKKLFDSLLAISALFVNLTLAVKSINNISASSFKSLLPIISSLLALSSSILLLSVALKSISSLSSADITKGVLGIASLAIILVNSAKAMSKAGGIMIKGSSSLLIFSVSLIVLSKAVEKLSKLDLKSLVKGLSGVGILLAELSIFAKKSDLGNIKIGNTIGIIGLAAALNILAIAVKQLGNLDLVSLSKGLGSVTVLLTVLAIFNKKGVADSKNIFATSSSLILLSSSLLILTTAINKLGDMSAESLIKGVLSLSASLAILVTALKFMPKDILGISVSLLSVTTSLVILSKSLQSLGDMSLKEIIKSIIALGSSLGILAISMKLMANSSSSAGGILIASIALNALAIAIKTLGSMKINSIVKSIIALTTTLGVIGGATILLAPLIPVLTSLSAALAIFSAACLAIGAGALALSAGLSMLAASGTAGAIALVSILTSVTGLIPMVIKQIGLGIVEFLTVIANSSDAIGNAFLSIIDLLITAVTQSIPKIVDAGVVLLVSFLTTIDSYLPQIMDSGINILISFVNGIASRLGDVFNVATQAITEFLNSLAVNGPRLIEGAYNAVITFIGALADTIREKTPELMSAMGELAGAMIEGLVNGLLGGIMEVGKSIINLGAEALNGIKDFLGIHSPSREFEAVGNYITQGLINGITSDSSALIAAVDNLSTSLLTAMQSQYPKFIEIGLILGNRLQVGMIQGIPMAVLGISSIFLALLEYIYTQYPVFMQCGLILSNRLAVGMLNGRDSLLSIATNIVMSIVGVINSQYYAFYNCGGYLVSGFISGIQSRIQEAANAAAEMARAALNAANSVLGIHSPSKVFMSTGKYVAMGLSKGINKFSNMAISSSENMVKDIINTADSIAKNIADSINNDMDEPIIITPVVDMSDVDSKSKMISSTLSKDASINVSGTSVKASKSISSHYKNKNESNVSDIAGKNETVVNYTQINNSPKALDRATIYRQTKNQLSTLKGALGNV